MTKISFNSKNWKPLVKRNRDKRVGEVNYNNFGEKMVIIEYRTCHDIDIKFEDGNIVRNAQYGAFKLGNIRNKHRSNMKRYREGEEGVNRKGYKMKIIAYRYAKDIDVQFEDGTISYHKAYKCFKTGQIMKPKKPFKKWR